MNSRTRTTPVALAAATAVAALVLSGCSTPSSSDGDTSATPGVTDDTVTIGTHTPLSGPAAAGYASVSAAALAYFDYVNDNGGIHGRTIEYLIKDDGFNPSTTQTVVRELVQEEKVFAIFNGLGTPTHASVVDYLNSNGVPDLFVASGATTWNQPEKYPYMFPFNADYVVEGAALAQYASDEFPGQEVCMLGQDDDLSGTLYGAELVLGQGGLARVEEYSSSNPDVTPQISSMKASGCEVVILATITGFTALSMTAAAQQGWGPVWMTSSIGADYPVLVELLGDQGPELLDGLIATGYLQSAESDNAWSQLFKEINEDYNGGAPFTGAVFNGMSAAYLFAEALYLAGEQPTRESIVTAIRSGQLTGNGVLPLSFSTNDHSSYRGVGIGVVKDGVQDFIDRAYRLDGEVVSAVELAPVPLTGNGVPGA